MVVMKMLTPVKVLVTCVQPFVTPWTCQAPLSMKFSGQEYWSGLQFPPPEDRPHSGIEPGSPALQVDSLLSKPPGKPWFSLVSQYFLIPLTTSSLTHWLSEYIV